MIPKSPGVNIVNRKRTFLHVRETENETGEIVSGELRESDPVTNAILMRDPLRRTVIGTLAIATRNASASGIETIAIGNENVTIATSKRIATDRRAAMIATAAKSAIAMSTTGSVASVLTGTARTTSGRGIGIAHVRRGDLAMATVDYVMAATMTIAIAPVRRGEIATMRNVLIATAAPVKTRIESASSVTGRNETSTGTGRSRGAIAIIISRRTKKRLTITRTTLMNMLTISKLMKYVTTSISKAEEIYFKFSFVFNIFVASKILGPGGSPKWRYGAHFSSLA